MTSENSLYNCPDSISDNSFPLILLNSGLHEFANGKQCSVSDFKSRLLPLVA